MFLLIFILCFITVHGCGTDGEPRVCSSPTTSQDRRSDKSVLSVAMINAEWLFWDDGKGGPSTKCPLDHSAGTCPWADKEEVEDHILAVAVELIEADVDIITIVEAQDCVVLQCLINAMGDKSYKPYLIPGKDTATDQNVGIISRIDPESALFRDEQRAVIRREDSPCGSTLPNPTYESGVSKHFIARFNVPGIGPFSLIGLHFLAYPTDKERCIKREAQATVIKNIFEKEMDAGREVIVLGDVNDFDADVLDASSSKPISRVSRILKYDDQGRKIMYNVAELIKSQPERYSNWWDKNDNCKIELGELSLIDHLLVSTKLRGLVESVKIYNIIQVCGSLQSDHYPVKVTLSTSSSTNTTILNK